MSSSITATNSSTQANIAFQDLTTRLSNRLPSLAYFFTAFRSTPLTKLLTTTITNTSFSSLYNSGQNLLGQQNADIGRLVREIRAYESTSWEKSIETRLDFAEIAMISVASGIHRFVIGIAALVAAGVTLGGNAQVNAFCKRQWLHVALAVSSFWISLVGIVTPNYAILGTYGLIAGGAALAARKVQQEFTQQEGDLLQDIHTVFQQNRAELTTLCNREEVPALIRPYLVEAIDFIGHELSAARTLADLIQTFSAGAQRQVQRVQGITQQFGNANPALQQLFSQSPELVSRLAELQQTNPQLMQQLLPTLQRLLQNARPQDWANILHGLNQLR